jgi:2-polyprenyl-3-methyl-5-hydroxy-6-metoxy-1,4-benzoquinol methylase
MSIVKDPEGIESSILHALVDFKNRRVLEIGCGDGRLTWRYASDASYVTAIDPNAEHIETGRANTPGKLKSSIQFVQASIEDFVHSYTERRYDIAIFAWSL